jgi:hypothetical protein
MLTRLDEAVKSATAARIAAAAHTIKGAAGLLSEGEAYDAARSLELRARGGDTSTAERGYHEIERSVSALMAELKAMRDSL